MVALSSTQAEYLAPHLAVKEATWLKLLLTELGLLDAEINIPISNTSAKVITAN